MPARTLPLLPLRRSSRGAKAGTAASPDTGPGSTPAPSTTDSGRGAGTGAGGAETGNGGASYTEHALSLAELAGRLELPYPLEAHAADPTALGGLPLGAVPARLARYGPNALTPPKGKGELRRFFEKFIDPFMILLELAAVLSLALYIAQPREQQSSLYVAVVLAAIILLTSLLAYYQEGQSTRVMGAFQGMMSHEAMVIREGLPQKIPADEVTVGDLVKLASGGRVPADVRVLASDGLKVDNSSFTGESLPVDLVTEATDAAHALHSHNMAFSSALIVEGEGLGIVVRVGDNTMIGSIATLATATKEEKSTLEVEVLRFVRFISFLAIATGVLFYSIAVGRGGDPLQMFITCFVVIVIANVPEGLPATVTSCLTISARRLAARQVFVKRLDVVETLGSTTVIASDKTGTLTQNRMTVSHLWVDGALKLGHYMQREGAWRNEGKDRDSFLELLYAAGLCNMAKFEEEAVAVQLQGVTLVHPPGAGAGAGTRSERGMSLLSSSNSSAYLRSRRLLTDFGGVATQDSRRVTMEAAAQARLRQLSDGGVVTLGPPPPAPAAAQRDTSILKADFFEEPASFRSGERRAARSKDHDEQHAIASHGPPPHAPPPSLATEESASRSPQTHVPHNIGTGATRLQSGLSGSGDGEGADRAKTAGERAAEQQQDKSAFPAIRRSLSHVLSQTVSGPAGSGGGALTVGRLSGADGGAAQPGRLRHHVTISDVTLASSVRSAAAGLGAGRGGLPMSMAARRSSAGNVSAASSLTTTLTMGRGVWGQAAASAARAALLVPTCKVVGNPSDVAIFNYVHGLADVERLRAERPLVYMLPFNSRTKWMLTVHSFDAAAPAGGGQGLTGGYLMYMKGAPEIILGKCDAILIKGQPRPLNGIYKRAYEDAYKEVAAQGERVLAVALHFLDPRQWAPGALRKADFKRREAELPMDGGLCFVGLVSLVDPPKPRVAEAVQKCKVAGVKVAMVTGDHPLTAEAIARKVNIVHDFATREEIARGASVGGDGAAGVVMDPKAVPDEQVGAAVIDCRELGSFMQADWDSLLRKPELVFARASPQDKLNIVQQLRRQGEVVAVTGDGVNDAPALKNSDIGLAMGIQGSEVAKNAANVILMDDDFSSIVKGIEEGRVLFDNLTKTIAYTLAHALPELVAVVINLIFNLPYGLTTLMILSIDMLTEIGPAVSFAWEPAEANVMERPPRNRQTDRLVRPALLAYAYLQAGVIETIFCLFAYFFVLLNNGLGFGDLTHPERVSPTLATMAATAYYVTLILSQALHLLAVKTRAVSVWDHGPLSSNIMMVYGVLVALGIMLFIVYVPGVYTAFGTYPRLSLLYFLPSLASGAFLVIWGETRKATLRNLYAREQVWGEVEESWFYKCFAW